MTSSSTSVGTRNFNVDEIRSDFPILQTRVHGKDLVYLDNAATAQKPQAVIDALTHYYTHCNANIHRAVHHLSEKATAMHDAARETVRRFIGADSTEEIIFVRGTTEAINLVATSYGGSVLQPGDRILISAMEHHSNIVPWQLIAERTGAKLDVIPMNEAGVLDMESAIHLLTDRTRIIGLIHVSNALGTVNPAKAIIDLAHSRGVPVLLDAAQSIPHLPVNVKELDVDFLAFSGHKVYGPTGIGVLYGKKALLDSMPPYQGGGDMIRSVTFEKSTWSGLPHKFEAGTPDIAGPIGLAAALDYLSSFAQSDIVAHEHDLMTYATTRLQEIDGVQIIGQARDKAGAISFVAENVHPHDLGTFLDHEGVAIRTGHHCAQPVMDFYNVAATARLSFGIYNNRQDIDAFITALRKTLAIFS